VEAYSRNPEAENSLRDFFKLNIDPRVWLNHLEALADRDLNEEDSKEVLSDINSLKSLSLDKFKNVLERNDLLNGFPTARFLQLLASFDSLEPFNDEKAKNLKRSLGPVSKDDLSKINSLCKIILNMNPSERATKLAAIKEFVTPYRLAQDDVIFAYQRLHSPQWYLLTDVRDVIFHTRLEAVLTDKYKRLYKGQHLLRKRAAFTKVVAACTMKYHINSIRDKYLAKLAKMKWTGNLLARGFHIGYYYGVTIEMDELLKDSLSIHAALSASFLDERYKVQNRLYQEAVQSAKELWEKGDPRWHHHMAKDLLKEKRFSMLSYDTLKKKLLPIAERYGKGFGKNKIQLQQV